MKKSKSSSIKKKILLKGIIDAINVPGFALGSTMMGFSVIAKESGFDIWMALITTLSVWGMPGQVAFASLYAVGSSLLLIFIAVTLANMRMMLMVISGSDLLKINNHNLPIWKKAILMHLMAITSWAQLSFIKDKYPPPLLLSYYIGFSITIFLFGLSGTIIGFYLNNIIPESILRIIIFMTPLYILLLVINSKQVVNKFAVMIGGSLSPVLFPTSGSWSILLSGIIGGSLSILIYELYKKLYYEY